VFLVGPPPDYDCITSISRLGRLYVIEDGAGRVLFEHDNDTEDLLSYRRLAAREDPFGLATWRRRLANTASDGAKR
jgi:hypothetical protein